MTKSFQFLFLPSELQHGGFARMAGEEIWGRQHQADSIQTISLCFTILWFLRRRIFQLSQSHLLNNSTDGGFVGISWLDSVGWTLVGWNGKEGTRSLPTVGLQPFYKQLCVGGFDNYSTQTFLVQFWILVELVFNCLLTVRLRPSLHLIQPATFWWIWVKSFDNKLNMMFSNCSILRRRPV